jgi:hypothetical protein
MAKHEREFHLPAGRWVEAGAPGIEEMCLSRDPATGDDTSLLRWEPGTESTPLGAKANDYWEEVYIIDGALTDLTLGQTFSAGMYACRPPGMRHGPWKSASGYLALVFRYRTR